MVLDYCVPKIIGELEGYIHYTKTIDKIPDPISRPEMSYDKTNTLELKPFF